MIAISIRVLGHLGLLAAVLVTSGCWDEDPCDPGQDLKDMYCYAAASGGSSGGSGVAGSGEGGSSGEAGLAGASGAGGDAGAPPTTSTFGVACSSEAQCGGDAPICAPPLGYCTNINCGPGEANEGICPEGWTCYPASGGNPSACLQL